MKLALATAIFLIATSASAEMVNGYLRSDGTYVAPYYRTPADGNPYNNLTPPPAHQAPHNPSTYAVPPSTYQAPAPRHPSTYQPQPCWATLSC